MSLVLSIAAKFLEKPRRLDDFIGFNADSLGIWATVGHFINEIDHSESLPTIIKRAVVRAQEDIKDIIRSATVTYDMQNKTFRNISHDEGFIKQITKRVDLIVDEKLKMDLKATLRDKLGGFWNPKIIIAATDALPVSSYERTIDPDFVISSTIEVIKYKKKHEFICNILLVISDAQTMTGIISLD